MDNLYAIALSLFAAADSEAGAYAVFIVNIVLACLMVVAAAFIIFVVMKQSGNTDGTEALSGSKKDDQDSFYGKNASSRREAKLKMWTFISAGAIALFAIVFIIINAVLQF